MIVYGTRATLLKADYIFDACPNCKTTNSVQMSVFGRYAHIFWIPFFPIGKTGGSVCTNCRQVLKLKQMPEALKLSYENLKTHTKPPIWHFSGLGLVGLIIVGVIISDRNKNEKMANWVLHPQKDDVYEIKIKDDAFTLYKVLKVEADTVYFYANKYQTNQETDLSNLANKEYETSETYGMPTKRLKEMIKNDEIIDIDRK